MSEPIDKTSLILRLLDVIETEVIPLTRIGVHKGNKLFGAAILRKSDWSTVIAETNNEIENPLWHGEVHALKRFYEKQDAPDPKDCLFLATHEPCSLCLSAIIWTGFDNFYYLFSHEDSRDAFSIPHDLKILKEVFRLEPGGYASRNAFWQAHAIRKMTEGCNASDKTRIGEKIHSISATYKDLSSAYQASKSDNAIPLN